MDIDEDLVLLGTGRSTSSSRRTSGGPSVVDNCSHALTSSLWFVGTDGSARLGSTPVLRERARPACRPSGRAWRYARSEHPAVFRKEAPPEVCGVEVHAPDGLVHRSELREREPRPDERRRDASSARGRRGPGRPRRGRSARGRKPARTRRRAPSFTGERCIGCVGAGHDRTRGREAPRGTRSSRRSSRGSRSGSP